MRSDDGAFFPGFILGVSLFLIIGFWALNRQESWWQRSAVQHGCAEWVMDSDTGETAWQWKEVQP